MRLPRLLTFVCCLTLVGAMARAQEVTVVRDVLGPEGPLFIDGNLYFVAWTTGSLSRWDGKSITVLNTRPGCSHNGLALTRQKTFLLACKRSFATSTHLWREVPRPSEPRAE